MAAAGILAGAMFKLTPAFFLVLLVLPIKGRPRSWRILFASLALLAMCALVLPLLGLPWAPWFLHTFDLSGAQGIANPSFASLATQLYSSSQGMALPPRLLGGLWLGYVALVFVVSSVCLERAWSEGNPRLWVLTLTPLVVLLHPRPMAYGYLLAIPAALALLPMRTPRGRAILTGALCVQPFLGQVTQFRDPWSSNLAFLTLLILWLAYAYSCAGRGGSRV